VPRGRERWLPDRRKRVDAGEEPLSLQLPRWIAQPLRRMERRDRQRPHVPQRQVREAWHPGLMRMDDVERVGREYELQVRAHAEGDSNAAPPGDRDRRPEHDRALERHAFATQPPESPAPGRQLDGPVRGREDDDLVTSSPQLLSGCVDVFVDRVGLRPRERRDHANAQAHQADCSGAR
jgi:hypothetical protein